MTAERRATVWDVLRHDQEDQADEAWLLHHHTPLHHRHDEHVQPYCAQCRIEDRRGDKSRRLAAAQALRQQQEAEEEQYRTEWQQRTDQCLPLQAPASH